MKTIRKLFLCGVAFALTQIARGDEEAAAKAEVVQIQHGTNGETVLTLDEPTQKRIGLETATLVAAQWQPEIRASGRVADALAFAGAVADYEGAQAAAAASHGELERTKTLAAQENASPRALDAARALADRDTFTLKSAQARFAADWGPNLASRTNLSDFAQKLQTENLALVKLSLPTGTFPQPLPKAAMIAGFNSETNFIAAEFTDDLKIDPATQMQVLLFSARQKLPANLAVTARLKTAGEPVPGVLVPASAVLRHEDKTWLFEQTGATEFSRREFSLDHPMPGGFFSAALSATNRVVVAGAQTLLSAELSGGNFNSGSRDEHASPHR